MGNVASSDEPYHTDIQTSSESEVIDVTPPENVPELISLYIKPNLLKLQKTIEDNKKVYEIKGETFVDVDQPIVDRYLEFELHAHKMDTPNFFKMDNCPDQYCALPEDDDEIEQPKSGNFQISTQKAPHGVIINSILYLPDHNWNTLVFLDPNQVRCIVCDKCLMLLECPVHMIDRDHEKQLDLYKPLPQFELNIFRKIQNNYHCGICNELFPTDDNDNHLDSKAHEDNQLFAYNKASDVIYDSDIYVDSGNKPNDCYHFNANRINNNNNDTDDYGNKINDKNNDTADYNFNENRINDWTISDWNNDNLSNANSDDYTEYTTNSESVDFDYEYDFTEYEINELPLPGVSYASMARKPKLYNNPKFLLIDTTFKKYKILYDYWNMILVNKNNTFYCMACKIQELIQVKAKHCNESQHLETLNSFKKVKKFENHIVREINEKLYHCAHCNRLQLVHDMESHLNRNHPIKIKNYEVPTASNIIKENDAKNKNNDKPNAINKNVVNKKNDKIHDNKEIVVNDSNIDDYNEVLACFKTNVGVYAFGPRINVLLMAYHVICPKDDTFYCGLCVVTLSPKKMVRHILDLKHIRLLQLHQFLPQFGNHLIRHIHGAFHCALCNTPIHENYIVIHIQLPYHIGLLSYALTPDAYNNTNTLTPIEEKPLKTNESNEKALTSEKTESVETSTVKNTELEETKIMTEETELMKQETGSKEETWTIQGTESKQETEIMIDEEIETNEMDDSMDSVDAQFDLESYVYVKFKGYFKLTATSYNSLVAVGNGNRYCFICNTDLEYEELKKHVDSREHEKNRDEYNFLDKYGENLIRQAYVLYHCCICNVILRHSELSKHIEWQPHTNGLRKMNNIMKKVRKIQIQSGTTKMYIIKTQKEGIFLDVKEPEIKILYSAVIIDNKSMEKMKLFLVNNTMLKIKFESWHGVAVVKNGFKCILCQIEFSKDIRLHLDDEEHEKNLEKEFLKEYSPNLIREINRDLVNCATCNIEVSSKLDVLTEHLMGKKHKKNYEVILKYSSEVSSYEDCFGDIITV